MFSNAPNLKKPVTDGLTNEINRVGAGDAYASQSLFKKQMVVRRCPLISGVVDGSSDSVSSRSR